MVSFLGHGDNNSARGVGGRQDEVKVGEDSVCASICRYIGMSNSTEELQELLDVVNKCGRDLGRSEIIHSAVRRAR